MKEFFQKHGWLALTFLTFFFLLGSRALNEPDEGRYAEIAREMVETGNWLVPHLWYLPHLDKPPMTYWLVAVSMKLFGQNEWAVRLPVALAGIGGVIATFFLGCSLGGRRVGIWSALILQSSLLYFVMARMLTTDVFLTLFNVCAVYFFWRSWIVGVEVTRLTSKKNKLEPPHVGSYYLKAEFFAWHLAGWIALALGFLTKGPIALAIPAVSFFALWIFRRKEIAGKKLLFAGLVCGFALFLILAAPWFLAVFQQVPQSAHFMILGQAAGHLLGTTIKNRTGSPFYFFAILLAGLLPWTILLGWLWRRNHWRKLDSKSKDGWLLLNVWAIFTFALFSLSHAKLPAYILPIFPALAILLAWKFFSNKTEIESAPKISLQIGLASSLLLPVIFPIVIKFIFHDELPEWLKWQAPIAAVIIIFIFWLARKWNVPTTAVFAVGLSLLGFFVTVAEIPQFETSLRGNQTLKPLGVELAKEVQPGDALVVWQRLPEGLPFYAGGVISPTRRPYFGGMDWTQIPFAFPGNRGRISDFILPDDGALMQLLQSGKKIWLIGVGKTVEKFRQNHPDAPLHLISQVGQWQLYSNR